jgi:membrane-bound serine protease (ClpP class)
MTWIIFLSVLGLILICLEIFLPGAIIGAIGGIALLASVVLAFREQGQAFGTWWLAGTLAVTLAAIYLAVKAFPRSRTGKKLVLESNETGFVSGGEGLSALVGAAGAALSALRPAGMAEIGGKRIDVVTAGEFIPPGEKITVVAVEGSRVVVKKASPRA